MGPCCSDRNDKHDSKVEFNMNHLMKIQLGSKESYASDNDCRSKTREKSKNRDELFKMNINRLITSYTLLTIRIIELDIIWNIMRHYPNDFTSSDYIVLDLRDKTKKKENFIKKFKCISYTIDEIERFPNERIDTFKRYLNNKKMIVINKGEEVDQCERFIRCLVLIDANVASIAILSPLIDNDNDNEVEYKDNGNENMMLLYFKTDDRWFNFYPFVLLALKSVWCWSGYNYFFIDKICNWDSNSNCISSSSSNSDSTGENKYSEFINAFDIRIILRLQLSNSNNGEQQQCQRYTIENENENIIVFKCNIGICFGNNDTDRNIQVYQLIETIKLHLLNQCSIVILYDDKGISNEQLIHFIINLLYQLTYWSLDNIKTNLNRLCPLFIKDINQILFSFQQESLSCFYSDSSNNQIEANRSFEGLLFKLKNEVSNNYLSVCGVIEKIVLNILQYPNDEIYYKIKCNSNTFKANIAINQNAIMILDTFGFELKRDDNNNDEGAYYALNKKCNIDFIRKLYYSFIRAVKKVCSWTSDNSNTNSNTNSNSMKRLLQRIYKHSLD